MASRGSRSKRKAARRQARQQSAAAASTASRRADEATAVEAHVETAAVARPAPRGRRRRPAAAWPLVGLGAAGILGLAVLAALALRAPAEETAATPPASIVVGIPGGEVIPAETPPPSPTPGPTTEPTPALTAEPTTEPAAPATPTPTLVPTPPPAATTPPPASAPAATPEPTAIVVAVAQPDDAVAAFYARAADGEFDAAYALWSDRMKATYPRAENLDNRFAETAGITFNQLVVVSQGPTSATVQANFTEAYDSGASREFIGYWELVRVDGRWLLDEPHY